MKKALSLIMALILCLGMISVVSAAEEDKATITFENAQDWTYSPSTADAAASFAHKNGWSIYYDDKGGGTMSLSTDVAYKGLRSLKIESEFPSIHFFGVNYNEGDIPTGATIKWHIYIPEGSPYVGMGAFQQNTVTWDAWLQEEVAIDVSKVNEWLDVSVVTQNKAITQQGFQLFEGGGDGSAAVICYFDSIEIVDRNGKMTATIDSAPLLNPDDVAAVTLDTSSLQMIVNDNATLTATVLPETAKNKKYTYTIDKPEIATIDENGKVTAVAKGSANITVTTEDGGYTATCKVTVNNPPVLVTGVTLDKTEVTLKIDETDKLKATVAPDDADIKKFTFKSDNEAIATVNNAGKIKAVAPGTATITVTTEDGAKTATCVVTVKGNVNLVLIIGIAAGAIVVIAAVVVLLLLNKKKKAAAAVEPAASEEISE